jgi:hypothetical protein
VIALILERLGIASEEISMDEMQQEAIEIVFLGSMRLPAEEYCSLACP